MVQDLYKAMLSLPTYVLISPVRNEARYIELTIKSVVAQRVRPARWVIVSDGSTDGTDEIVRRYAANHSWIEFVRLPDRSERNFSGKVHAFNAGYARVRDLDYEVIGSLDADISFDPDYLGFLLEKLSGNPRLGVVGTPFMENAAVAYDYRFVSVEHVSGACQVFRRQCFEEIGGYMPVRGGGIDYIAVVTARMKGWKTRTFREIVCAHHRAIGSAQNGAVAARFRNGMKDYAVGNHPAWELARSCYQMLRRPVVVGGVVLLSGYMWALIRRTERPVSKEFVAFTRKDQMRRLTNFVAARVLRWQLASDTSEYD